MKKILVMLLALTVTAGVFAEVEVSVAGSIMMDIGTNVPMSDDDDPSVHWDMFDNGNTWIQAKAKGENISAWVRTRPGDVWMGDATVNLSAFDLSVGFNRLPLAYWSSFEMWGDNNYAYGPSSTSRTAYIQMTFSDFIFGIAEGGALHGRSVYKAWSPYIYLGYTFADDDENFEAGAKFVAAHLSGNVRGADTAFSFMGQIFGTLLMLDPVTLGLNAALYGSPDGTIFNVSDNPVVGSRADNLVVEALVDVGLDLDTFFVSFSAGLVTNLDAGGIGLKFAANAIFDIGGTGFSIIPGIAFTTNNYKDGNIDKSHSLIDAGCSFAYSF